MGVLTEMDKRRACCLFPASCFLNFRRKFLHTSTEKVHLVQVNSVYVWQWKIQAWGTVNDLA